MISNHEEHHVEDQLLQPAAKKSASENYRQIMGTEPRSPTPGHQADFAAC